MPTIVFFSCLYYFSADSTSVVVPSEGLQGENVSEKRKRKRVVSDSSLPAPPVTNQPSVSATSTVTPVSVTPPITNLPLLSASASNHQGQRQNTSNALGVTKISESCVPLKCIDQIFSKFKIVYTEPNTKKWRTISFPDYWKKLLDVKESYNLIDYVSQGELVLTPPGYMIIENTVGSCSLAKEMIPFD